jgi:hypothetical protein
MFQEEAEPSFADDGKMHSRKYHKRAKSGLGTLGRHQQTRQEFEREFNPLYILNSFSFQSCPILCKF